MLPEVSDGLGGDLGGSRRERRFKVSFVLDPTDEAKVPAVGQGVVDQHFSNIARRRGRPACEAAEPTADQLAAMRIRVVELGDAPYADFSFDPLRRA